MITMTKRAYLTHLDVKRLCKKLSTNLVEIVRHTQGGKIKIYPIPRGGVPVAYMLQNIYHYLEIVDKPEQADLFIDDIIDSGSTMTKWCDKYPGKPFFALIDKTSDKTWFFKWVVFPWENSNDAGYGIEDNIRRILQYIGEDLSRGGLKETPERYRKALDYWFKGYKENPTDILKVFEDGGQKYNEMIIVKNIPLYSKCEHHMADIIGTATVGYIPNGKIVGLSKINRLVDVFARRLQVQERLTQQIAHALNDNLNPKGVGVQIKARHMCMESRGICQQGHHTITTTLLGALYSDPNTRTEFLHASQ